MAVRIKLEIGCFIISFTGGIGYGFRMEWRIL